MKFDILRGVYKALKSAAVSALTIAVVAGTNRLLDSFDTSEELAGLKIPVLVVPIVLGAVSLVRNYLKTKDTFASIR